MIGVIINYCSNENMFLHAQLTQCSLFASNIVVSYADKLYNGDLEDNSFVQKYQEMFPKVKFVEYNIDMALSPSDRKGVHNRPTAYWHNLARWTAIIALDYKTEWVFVIDADEIPEGDRVLDWLNTNELHDRRTCYKIACYWYFKYPIYQALSFEDSILLIHKSFLTEDNIFGDYERDFLITNSKTKLLRMNMGNDGKPLWHHYSFVRTRANLKKKLSSWGHVNDIFKNVNVDQLIEYVYRDEGVNDFVHGYKYIQVPNKFNIVLNGG